MLTVLVCKVCTNSYAHVYIVARSTSFLKTKMILLQLLSAAVDCAGSNPEEEEKKKQQHLWFSSPYLLLHSSSVC